MEEISRVMTDTYSKSVRRLSAEVNIGKTTAHKALRQELRLFPYNVMAVHELQSFDAEKRIAYCRWFKSLIARRGDDFLHNVFFFDEVWFHLNGHVNSQNSRVWSSGNLHILHERPLHSEKIGVWVAMSATRIVGPIFFNETINADRYCSIILTPFLNDLRADEQRDAFFQEDGACLLYTSPSPRDLSTSRMPSSA